jgi:hypothetical protein
MKYKLVEYNGHLKMMTKEEISKLKESNIEHTVKMSAKICTVCGNKTVMDDVCMYCKLFNRK